MARGRPKPQGDWQAGSGGTVQPRSLGKKKSQNKGVRESSTSSLIMKEAWVERGGRAQRGDRREVGRCKEQSFYGGTGY